MLEESEMDDREKLASKVAEANPEELLRYMELINHLREQMMTLPPELWLNFMSGVVGNLIADLQELDKLDLDKAIHAGFMVCSLNVNKELLQMGQLCAEASIENVERVRQSIVGVLTQKQN
jgi:hypothetical protein